MLKFEAEPHKTNQMHGKGAEENATGKSTINRWFGDAALKKPRDIVYNNM